MMIRGRFVDFKKYIYIKFMQIFKYADVNLKSEQDFVPYGIGLERAFI